MDKVKFGYPFTRLWIKIERKSYCIENVRLARAIRAKYSREIRERANDMWLPANSIDVTIEGCEIADFDGNELKFEV